MIGIDAKKENDNVVIRHQFTKIEIPVLDITEVKLDDTYGGEPKEAIRVGIPYGTTDRIAIKTKNSSYILYTTNYVAVMNKLNSFIKGK
ncbi:SunI/YnzG family protein [Niallia nealsonii]|uniref:Sublancin immunity protein SunI-like PH domain-containing protein n=1 Tax=Niallia nealsonii TaxID=115979 RepID=A0A2N0Z0V6_9BACI|nr:hypothetical protein [Niallia nealsonii]PKG23123.1 hypothetical protein CWS01_13715 [Niallia nealsonii]